MKSLTEIKRNLTSFYSSIQSKVTDFSVGSVVGGLFYSFAASMESAYAEIESVKAQAYVSTATGEYLDRLIDGTFRLERTAATRSSGYVVLYANNPLPNPASVTLRYAEYDYTTGEFISGLQAATKFIGYNEQGEDGIVYALINPKNSTVTDAVNKLIILNRSVQYLILPVASVIAGSASRVREGGIYSFPSPPAGLTGVLNTKTPGKVFFSSQQSVSGSPFFSRFTEILGYDNTASSFSVINAYNFSKTGVLEITGNTSQSKTLVGTYTENQNGTGEFRQYGLLFPYTEAGTYNITLALPVENSLDSVPQTTVLSSGEVKTLTLHSFSYDGVTYTNLYNGTFDTVIKNFITSKLVDGLRVRQRPDQISDALIFDPDAVLDSSYELVESAVISGGTDVATDAEYRESLRKYLASLAKATRPALEAGALQIPGVTFARTLPSTLAPRGSAILLASDNSGTLPSGLVRRIRESLDENWKAAGINVIVRAPDLIKVHVTLSVVLEPGVFSSSITQKIAPTLASYFESKDPGDSLRYSEILAAISSIAGISNVYNLILSKELTTGTYFENKSSYDSKLLFSISSSGLTNDYPADSGFAGINGSPINLVSGVVVQALNVATADGILYQSTVGNPQILLGDAEVLSDVYQSLFVDTSSTTSERYIETALVSIAATEMGEDEKLYLLSYLISEPLLPSDTSTYPFDPDVIIYSDIRDYDSKVVEVFRQNSVTLGTIATPVVGIKYV
jgi:uncharacterized phage protein gp47/JayE